MGDGGRSGTAQTENTVGHTKYGRIRRMVVDEGGRSTGVLLYIKNRWVCITITGLESPPAHAGNDMGMGNMQMGHMQMGPWPQMMGHMGMADPGMMGDPGMMADPGMMMGAAMGYPQVGHGDVDRARINRASLFQFQL